MSSHARLVFAAAAVLLNTSISSAEAVRPLGVLPAEATTIADYYRQSVYDPADQKIGEIVDLLIEKEGHIPAAMISVGSFLALTKKVVAIPFTALQVVRGTQIPPRAGYRQVGAPTCARLRVQPLGQALAAGGGGIVMKILMVLTSHDRLGNTGRKTGFWLEEFAAPYYVFKDAGVEITLASPKGGHPPIDPRSEGPDAQTPATRRFMGDADARSALAHTIRLKDTDTTGCDALFYPGGHGPLWDLAEDRRSVEMIETMSSSGRFVAAVCHGPGVFHHTKAQDGSPLVRGKSVTGFSNSEEAAVGLTHVVPFLVEDMLRENGGVYSKSENWQPHVAIDGNLVTGQNPASSDPAAKVLLHHWTLRQLSLMPVEPEIERPAAIPLARLPTV
jgi:putative intracellular protease/amidase